MNFTKEKRGKKIGDALISYRFNKQQSIKNSAFIRFKRNYNKILL